MTRSYQARSRTLHADLERMFTAIARRLAPKAKNHHVLFFDELVDDGYILRLTHEQITAEWSVRTRHQEPHRIQLYDSREDLIKDTGVWWKPDGKHEGRGLCFTMVPVLGAYWYAMDKAEAIKAEAQRAERALLALRERLPKRYQIGMLNDLIKTFADLKLVAAGQPGHLYELQKLMQLVRQNDERRGR